MEGNTTGAQPNGDGKDPVGVKLQGASTVDKAPKRNKGLGVGGSNSPAGANPEEKAPDM
jgi:hypothetical protein